MSPGRNPHSGSSPSRHGPKRSLLLSSYQDGNPYSEFTGPATVRPPGFFTLIWVAAMELVASPNEAITPTIMNKPRRTRVGVIMPRARERAVDVLAGSRRVCRHQLGGVPPIRCGHLSLLGCSPYRGVWVPPITSGGGVALFHHRR